jgi:hypothetical protein
MAPTDFQSFLDRAAKHLGSQAALAKALGIDPTRISRLIRGAGDYAHLNFENCLRLAAILDEWPAEVLRAAGHTEQAALLEQLCGPPDSERSIKSSEWQLLHMWRDLPADRQAAILTLLKTEGRPAAPPATVRREFPRHVRRRSGT